ncbi:MAG: fibronectin type III-like domain-contianing protein [Bacteroidales bacterium]|nr:fibronectin type III-like domain-contianing protein [Bacteroidales bacterium]
MQEGDNPDGTYLIANAKPFLTYSSPYGGLNLASTPGGWYDLWAPLKTVYIRQEYCFVTRPIKELKAFKKISIEPGETKQVSFKIRLKDWGYYNNKGDYLLETGRFFIMVGKSAEDIKFTKTIDIG